MVLHSVASPLEQWRDHIYLTLKTVPEHTSHKIAGGHFVNIASVDAGFCPFIKFTDDVKIVKSSG